MRKKQIIKITVDLLMTILLLLLMTYELLGHAFHERIGCGMFLLFILHHVLNCKWLMGIGKGHYIAFRVVQLVLAVLIFVCMIGSMVSGIFLSQTVFVSLALTGDWANAVHMLCAYWGFVWMSLHLGLHWSIITGMAKKAFPKENKTVRIILRIFAAAFAGFGVYAFVRQKFPMYMTLKYHFALLNYDEPFLLLFDYIAIMGLFIWLGHYFGRLFRKAGQKKSRKADTI